LDNLTSSFSTWTPFISSSCRIALARNSKTILNKSRVSRHPCLVSDFRGSSFSFSPFSTKTTCIVDKYFCYFLTRETLSRNTV
jgi:hypothetical protein